MNANLKNKNQTSIYEYIIIGFGASGIAAAIQLSLAKKSFKIIEKTSYFGGCWNWALPSSCLQTHRAFYKFASVDYDRGTSAFPNKLEVLNYFRKAIDIYNLFHHVEFNCEAKYKRHKTQWLINVGSSKEISCNHILDCSGVNKIPNIPRIFHSTNITNINDTNKTRVIHTYEFNKFISRSNVNSTPSIC